MVGKSCTRESNAANSAAVFQALGHDFAAHADALQPKIGRLVSESTCAGSSPSRVERA